MHNDTIKRRLPFAALMGASIFAGSALTGAVFSFWSGNIDWFSAIGRAAGLAFPIFLVFLFIPKSNNPKLLERLRVRFGAPDGHP